MKLSELIERLEELRDECGEDADPEVVCAYQPNYPLAGEVLGVAKLEGPDDDEEGDDDAETDVVWLAVGNHPHGMSPYAPRGVFEVV